MADETTTEDTTEEEVVDPWEGMNRLNQPPPLTPTDRFDLSWDADDFDSDSPRLTEADAIRIITKRLPIDSSFVRVINNQRPLTQSTMGLPRAAAELARKIAVLIPDELMTRDALENMDMRAPLQQVMMAPAEQSETGETDINGVNFTDFERQIAGMSLVTLTEKYRTEWQNEATARTNEGLDVERQAESIANAVDETLAAFREGNVVRIPEVDQGGTFGVDPETGKLVANADDVISQAVEEDFNADLDLADVQIERRFLSGQDVQTMLAGGELDIDTLRSIEQAEFYTDPTAHPDRPRTLDHGARITYTDDTRDSGNKLPDHLTSQRDVEKDWYSINEALALPGTFSPQERVAIVKRLERAGFLAKGDVLGGDTTSAAFKAAWKTLAQSALERGVSMTQFLSEREQTYQESIMSSFATRLTDPARVRISGDSIGKNILGRKLTEDEQAQMIEFVHGLERRNAQVEAGLDATEGVENGVAGLDEGITADIDARMQEWVRSENGAEAGAEDVADQYEAFTRMLSGPGRGVG